MVSWDENKARIKDHFRFTKQEWPALLVIVVLFGFIFSFRDWGEESFNPATGIAHLILATAVVGISLFVRISCQKIYSLTQGYLATFRIWWGGVIASLVIAFATVGRLPLVLIGGVVLSFFTRHRLGEFRYGFSYVENCVAALWSVWSSLILAIIASFGLLLLPDNYFFKKMLVFNFLMAISALLPFPQLEGLQAFFGSRAFYYLAIVAVIAAAALLLPGAALGVIIATVVGLIIGIVFILKGSEK